ncbi:MAG TPA: aminopeptidase P family protein, partial [Bacteroidales bacterium]|nr:aminopeptidase P family protein [Bacteroidales bacterium]
MFNKEIYQRRRDNLRSYFKSGILLFPGNTEVPLNYNANTYRFRQDSSFLYFFGLDQPDLFGIIDIDNNGDYLFGNDIDIEDIIWMGNLPTVSERAASVGISKSFPLNKISEVIQEAKSKGRDIHYLYPYRGETIIQFQKLFNVDIDTLKKSSSEALSVAVCSLRSKKGVEEILELDKIVDVAGLMHTTAMRMAKAGVVEREIAGVIEGIALSQGAGVSFPVILSKHGETLHNHLHGNVIQSGDLLLVDAGAESESVYASDITRTTPVGGKFSQKQKEIYEIVLAANMATVSMSKPGVYYKDVHLNAARVIAEGLKAVGLMKGDMTEAVSQGAHALFFPHGLGHMLGMDVHDMENIGEKYVGYDNTVSRSDQFGLAYLRMAKKLEIGYVVTDEPGIYFIPALIDQWRAESKFKEFINYELLESYKGFGGIRIEDDILNTTNNAQVFNFSNSGMLFFAFVYLRSS